MKIQPMVLPNDYALLTCAYRHLTRSRRGKCPRLAGEVVIDVITGDEIFNSHTSTIWRRRLNIVELMLVPLP